MADSIHVYNLRELALTVDDEAVQGISYDGLPTVGGGSRPNLSFGILVGSPSIKALHKVVHMGMRVNVSLSMGGRDYFRCNGNIEYYGDTEYTGEHPTQRFIVKTKTLLELREE